jgi:predicted transposase YbfD/YdcC
LTREGAFSSSGDGVAIEGAIVTIDAMGCQRDIARTIIDKEADYVLALKANQGSLRDDVEVFVAEQKAKDFQDTTISRHQTVDGDRGRVETRTTTVIHDIAWLQERHNWPGLKAIVMDESLREIDGKIERETRFYITSLLLLAAQISSTDRSHWAIENSLHWVHGPDLSRRRFPRKPHRRMILYPISLEANPRDPIAAGFPAKWRATCTSTARNG